MIKWNQFWTLVTQYEMLFVLTTKERFVRLIWFGRTANDYDKKLLLSVHAIVTLIRHFYYCRPSLARAIAYVCFVLNELSLIAKAVACARAGERVDDLRGSNERLCAQPPTPATARTDTTRSCYMGCIVLLMPLKIIKHIFCISIHMWF